ncbi:MAG: DNA topoisomerase IB [Mucilaginibacter polytrichastri]|nr:DNA topoisomerase IB [Mucilaginibacter polytrichastri]
MSRLRSKLEKIGRDPKITARAVGLRYISDDKPGFHRKKSGSGFTFTDAGGKTVKDKTQLERFAKLVIPPAYTDVWISPSENGHLQFTGKDVAGRKQYRYHTHWNTIRNQSKYHRMELFARFLPKIREQVQKDLNRRNLDFEKVLALVIRLMELTHIRVGNESYSKLYGSFGLTTLRDRHVKVNGAGMEFEFIGKKGVRQKVALQSRKLAKLVKQCRDIPGKELFQYYDEDGKRQTVDSGDVNAYLREITGEDFTAKDFRTWSGSVEALHALHEIGGFDNQTQCKKNIVQAVDNIAACLGNTRSVCRKYYVHPAVIDTYERGKLLDYLKPLSGPAADPGTKLTKSEKVFLNILKKEEVLKKKG